MDRLARAGRASSVARRGVIALDGAAVTVVRSGWMRVFRNAAFVRDVTLALAGPGELLAPGALFGDRSAESGAAAITDAEVVLLAPEAAETAAGGWAALAGPAATSLAHRAMRVERKLEAFSRSPVEARVAAALLEVAEAAGTPVDGGAIRLDLPLSQEDLAGLAGTVRETCSSAVASLARQGLVRGSRLRGLVLVRPDVLAGVAAVDFRGP